ncbi:hypothetical protein CLF_108779 [Clonorchis sinensis]|uniref:Uncharacterized protein n=1 Tax=Clonorchis sinensis TaxID=79923 RepID=G7YII4_CLOSI|nr:hypothetical protein CLF_108779 [Clonorchis sinensis]
MQMHEKVFGDCYSPCIRKQFIIYMKETTYKVAENSSTATLCSHCTNTMMITTPLTVQVEAYELLKRCIYIRCCINSDCSGPDETNARICNARVAFGKSKHLRHQSGVSHDIKNRPTATPFATVVTTTNHNTEFHISCPIRSRVISVLRAYRWYFSGSRDHPTGSLVDGWGSQSYPVHFSPTKATSIETIGGSVPTTGGIVPVQLFVRQTLGQPGSIQALVLPSGGMAVRHRKGATAERVVVIWSHEANLLPIQFCTITIGYGLNGCHLFWNRCMVSGALRVPKEAGSVHRLRQVSVAEEYRADLARKLLERHSHVKTEQFSCNTYGA